MGLSVTAIWYQQCMLLSLPLTCTEAIVLLPNGCLRSLLPKPGQATVM